VSVLRNLEAKLEGLRTEHYAAGDALHDKQGAYYAANSEVTRLEQQLAFARESETRLTQQVAQLTEQIGALAAQEAALLTSLPPPAKSFVLYFDLGTATPTPASQAVLTALRAEIASRSGPQVEVTGHTDTVGSEADNDRLSQQRAEEVLNWLAGQGFDRSLMSAVGRGERELKEPTMDNISNAANRRVEVIVR